MEVFENLISEDITNKIKGTLFSGMFPWYFLNDITFDSEYGFDKIKKPGHFHNFYKNSLSTSSYSKIVEDIVQVVVNHKKIPRVVINRARSFLQFPFILVARLKYLEILTGSLWTVASWYLLSPK